MSLTDKIALIALGVALIAAIAAIVVVHNAKLKYGLLISLSILVIGSIVMLWRLPSEGKPINSNGTLSQEKPKDPNPAQNLEPLKPKDPSVVNRPPKPSQQPKETADKAPKYEVTLIIPSHMSNADILVDEKPAVVIDRQLTVVKIRVEQKDQPTKILLRKGEQRCAQTLLIHKNIELTPCQ